MRRSISKPISKRLQLARTNEIMQRDSAFLRGLTAAGFATDSGPDSSGLMMKYLSRDGGYYIDTAASPHIIDRKIKIKQAQEIKAIKAHSLISADVSELKADVIVFATGYQNRKETAGKMLGKELAEGVQDVWGIR